MTTEKRIIQGAAQAALGRIGAVLEAVSLFVFAALYGMENFGIYVSLWATVKILTGLTECAFPSALQRFVPLFETHRSGKADALAGFALFLSLGLALLVCFSSHCCLQ